MEEEKKVSNKTIYFTWLKSSRHCLLMSPGHDSTSSSRASFLYYSYVFLLLLIALVVYVRQPSILTLSKILCRRHHLLEPHFQPCIVCPMHQTSLCVRLQIFAFVLRSKFLKFLLMFVSLLRVETAARLKASTFWVVVQEDILKTALKQPHFMNYIHNFHNNLYRGLGVRQISNVLFYLR